MTKKKNRDSNLHLSGIKYKLFQISNYKDNVVFTENQTIRGYNMKVI